MKKITIMTTMAVISMTLIFCAQQQKYNIANYDINDYSKDVNGYEEYVLQWLEQADNGNTEAEYKIGVCYYRGLGVEQDPKLGIDYMKKAANNNHPVAQYILGVDYCTTGNATKAVEFYKKSADQGYLPALSNLAECYIHGEGIAQDSIKGLELLTKSAEKGNFASQNNLGMFYQFAQGDFKNLDKSFMWLDKAATSGDQCAIYNLAHCYKEGIGTKVDYDKAEQLFIKAAELGFGPAQVSLGLSYYWGQPFKEDKDKAKMWLTKAADQGEKDAIDYLEEYKSNFK